MVTVERPRRCPPHLVRLAKTKGQTPEDLVTTVLAKHATFDDAADALGVHRGIEW